METRVEELDEPCRKKVSVAIDADQVEKQYRQSFAELRNTVALPGFRRGKVPMSMLEKRFGPQIAEDVKRDLVVEGMQRAIKDNDLDVVADPEFDFEAIVVERGAAIAFEMVVETKPEFELPDYRGVPASREVAPVTDEDVDKVLGDLARQRAVMAPVTEGAVVADDHVIGHFEVLEGDEVIFERQQDGAIAGDAEKLAQIPFTGLGEALVGKAVGDVLTASSTVPDDYPVQDMRGKDVDLRFTIKEVKRLETPEIDDELAKGFGFDDLAAFRAKIVEDLGEHREHEADHDVEEKIIDTVLGRVDFPVPPTVLKSTIDSRIREMAMQALMQGRLQASDLDAWSKSTREELEPEARRSIRAWYLIQKIGKKEKIFATESDVAARITEIARQEGRTPTQIREALLEKDAMDDVRASVLERKVRKFLRDKAEIAEGKAAANGGE